jgi:hypothetical protein
MKMTLASNHKIIHSYYNILKNLLTDFRKADHKDEKREMAFLIIITSVTVMETFLNIYFYLLASEEMYIDHFEQIKREINDTSFSLDKKIKSWPQLLFKKKIDFSRGVGQKFQNLKNLRNRLLHFHSRHHEINMINFRITKLLDISIYEYLDEYDVDGCVKVVVDFAVEIFRLAGGSEKFIGEFIHQWFGELSRKGNNH